MSIQKVNNFTIQDKHKQNNNSLAFSSDRSIIHDSISYGKSKTQDLKSVKMLEISTGLMLGTITAISAAKQPGKLSDKMLQGVKILGLFTFLGGMLSVFAKSIKEKISNKEKLNNNNNNILQAMLGTGLIMGSAVLGVVGLKSASKYASKNMQNIIKPIEEKIQPIKDKIDNSELGLKTEEFKEKYQNFINKNKVAKFIDKNAFPLTLLGYIASVVAISPKIKEDRRNLVVSHAKELYNLRDDARKNLDIDG